MNKKYYAGIGSRETPLEIGEIMTMLSSILEKENYILRSGGANGADTFFEQGIKNDNKEIYLPWKNFNNNSSTLFNISEDAINIAKRYHPVFDTLSSGAKKLMARNVYQVLGYDLKTPSEFILCWTKNGKLKGGTSQAIRIANDYGINVINLGNPIHLFYITNKYNIKVKNKLF